MSKSIVLFDGVCNLCSKSVQFILKRDRKDRFVFASLQSRKGKEILRRFHMSATRFDSFVLVEKGKIYTRSGAALRIARSLNGAWPLLYVFIIVPPFIRNAVYNLISRNRYKWFGRKEQCWVPTRELRKKFID
jgi:predicted DCC family thiol-disulfide oxidoreductase YuxK